MPRKKAATRRASRATARQSLAVATQQGLSDGVGSAMRLPLSRAAQALGGELLAESLGEALVLLGRVVDLGRDAKHALRRPPHDGHLDLPVVEEALLERVAGTPTRLDRGVRRQDHASQRADHLLRASGGCARRRAEELARGQSKGAIARHESGPAAGDELT